MREALPGTCRHSPQSRPRRRRPHSLVLALVLVAATGCEGSRTTSSFSTRGIVYGTVTDAAGVPVGGANVRAVARPGSCGAADQAVATGQPTVVLTDVNGDYAQMLTAGHSPFTGCVTVEILQPGGNPLVLATAMGTPLAFTPSNEQAAYDSIRVDIRLP